MIAAPSVSRLQARHVALLAVAATGAAVAGRPPVPSVVLGGGAIGLVLLVYGWVGRLLVEQRRASLAIGLLFAKLAAFLGLGWVVLTSGEASRPDPVGFALGLSCFPAAAVWEAMRARGRG